MGEYRKRGQRLSKSDHVGLCNKCLNFILVYKKNHSFVHSFNSINVYFMPTFTDQCSTHWRYINGQKMGKKIPFLTELPLYGREEENK